MTAFIPSKYDFVSLDVVNSSYVFSTTRKGIGSLCVYSILRFATLVLHNSIVE